MITGQGIASYHVSSLLVYKPFANSKDELESVRKSLCIKRTKSPHTMWANLLSGQDFIYLFVKLLIVNYQLYWHAFATWSVEPGAKPIYLDKYRSIKKVKKLYLKGISVIYFEKKTCMISNSDTDCTLDGFITLPTKLTSYWGNAECVVAHLGQDPLQRPIVGKLLPTLLKGSYMWMMYKDENKRSKERMMIGKDWLIILLFHTVKKKLFQDDTFWFFDTFDTNCEM